MFKSYLYLVFGSEDSPERLSWRKILTSIAGVAFLFAVIGFEFGLPELPREYQLIITMVFTFYFSKDLIDNIQIGKHQNKI